MKSDLRVHTVRLSLFLLATGTISSWAQQVDPPPPSSRPPAAELFSRMAKRHDWQEAHLKELLEVRTYRMEDDKHKLLAEQVVSMKYAAPSTKSFSLISEKGSGFIRHHVFQKLMKDEEKRAGSKESQDGLIVPANYTLEVLGDEKVAGVDCFIVHATPQRKDTHLFEGRMWITHEDFAIVKIAGRLAKSPSFWVKHVDFTRDYQQVKSLWLPARVEAVSKVRFFGTRILTIDYDNKSVNVP